jgi:hypothetical protein
MPSYEHEGLIRLFRNRPELAPELLRDGLRIELPAYSEARVESADLTDLEPAERHADLVVLLIDGKPVLGIVLEVQLSPDPKKRRSWPAYVVGLRARLDCPACVLVVTVTEAMARWAREPIELGPGNAFRPLVVGPSAVPVIDDVAVAERDPEMAVLSALAHGEGPHGEHVGRAAVLATLRLSNESQLLYSDLVLAAVSEAARTALEKLMASGDYEFQSDFAKRYIAKGMTEGMAKGVAEGCAKSVLAVLEARGLRASDEGRARILACTNVAQLDTWIRKAVSVNSVDELF